MVAEPLPALVTVDEAASALRVSPFTIRRMLRDGQLHAIQLRGPGSSLRIPVDELRRVATLEQATR